MTGVKSIAGLRREVDELADKEDARLTDKTLPEIERARIRSRIHAYNQSLSKIDSLTAGLRGRLEELKGYRQHSPVGSQSGAVLAEKIEELRRVLGGRKRGGAE